MGSLGYVMFHLVGIGTLVLIAVMIARIAVPRRPRRDEREIRRLPDLQHSGPNRLTGPDD